ncbi:MAG: hypothetical protein WBG30_11470 [Psychrilyobacter sp.]|uniref:hypothetical protein n=1 Tax=Psychrilyobacter sp. TaxID=2586924 RepID=UPI003C789B4F
MKRMQLEINGDMVKINDILIFGVNDLEIGDDYVLLKKDNDNLIHFIDHEKEINPYFTVIRIKDGERLAHNYKYCNFKPIEIMEGYHKKTL